VIGAEPAGGTVSSTTQYFGTNGKISDVRVYNTVLAIGDLQKLASKMFIGVGAPVAWYKLNEETASGGGAGTGYFQDSGSGGHQGTATGASWTYNDFGVDIQDNTTTVSNLIVESGQLNTKSLTYATMSGSNQRLSSPSFDFRTTAPSYAISFWMNPANISGTKRLIHSDQKFALSQVDGTLVWAPNYDADMSATATVLAADTWHHVIAQFDTAGNAASIYVDGVQKLYVGDSTADKTGAEEIFFGCKDDLSLDYTGSMRDIRMYDYSLSADQAASLYRGTYNVTPEYAWKCDEGTGNCSGWGTAQSGGAADLTHNAGWATTASLKVNGAARVLDNGSVL